MTAKAPIANDPRYNAMKAEQKAATDKMMTGKPVTEREKMQFLYGSIADVNEMSQIFILANQETARIRKSKSPKDIFKRIISLGFMLPDTSDQKAIKAARAIVVDEYEKAMAEYDASAAEKEALRQQAALTDRDAERLKELEQHQEAINTAMASGTGRSMNVAKPLKLKSP